MHLASVPRLERLHLVVPGRVRRSEMAGPGFASGTAKPEQERGRCLCHFKKSVESMDDKPDRGGGRIRPRRHKWYLYRYYLRDS
jgi:hypothetical protein